MWGNWALLYLDEVERHRRFLDEAAGRGRREETPIVPPYRSAPPGTWRAHSSGRRAARIHRA